MTPDQHSYLVLFVATACYAAFLNWLDRAYEPDWTILTVVGGVGLTWCGVAYRLMLGVPQLPPEPVAWWALWSVGWHFCVSGFVIALWQIWQVRKRLLNMVAYLRGRTRGHTPDRPA
jgi:asparagine N-glycosylation enzyme membrane subunit Stt3